MHQYFFGAFSLFFPEQVFFLSASTVKSFFLNYRDATAG